MRRLLIFSLLALGICGQQAYAGVSRQRAYGYSATPLLLLQREEAAKPSQPDSHKATDPPIDPDKPGGPPSKNPRNKPPIDPDKPGGPSISSGHEGRGSQGDVFMGSGNTRSVASGQKMKIKGIVTRREADTFTIRDDNGVETVVRLADNTSVKTKGGFLRSGRNYGTTSILRGLYIVVEGRGDSSGQLVASNVRFGDSDLRAARTAEARVDPVESRVGTAENRLGQVEQNAQRLSGQIDELAAVSNAAKGGARAAQATADAAVSGVNTTNERISALDDYVPQETTAIKFRVNSAVLSSDAKAQLDDLANKAMTAKGYVIEISGYTDSSGSVDKNRRLSSARADAVVRYLAENHRIPLRRIITPFGYGESNAVAENTTREGRAQNRRVEVKILVNRGLQQGAPVMATPAQETPN